jgi:hypothetical protein
VTARLLAFLSPASLQRQNLPSPYDEPLRSGSDVIEWIAR